jgi:nucleoside-diphosphate-sugar epimerase
VIREKLVIIGGSSYVGNYLHRYCFDRGLDVTAATSKDCNLLEPDAVAAFFSSLGPAPCSVVFLAVLNKQMENSYRSLTLNNQMAKNFLDGLNSARVESVIWFSSVDVYGAAPRLPITEDTAINPDTWYGLAKYNGEWMAATSGELTCPVAVLRIPGVFGNSTNDRSVIGKMVKSVCETGQLVINGNGRILRDYVFIDDVARAVTELVPLRYRGTLNLVTGTSRAILEVAELLRGALGDDFAIEHRAPDGGREFDLCFDNGRFTSVLPTFEFTDISTGMRTYRRLDQPLRSAPSRSA